MGPVGADVPVLLDDAVAPGPYVTGANREGRAPARASSPAATSRSSAATSAASSPATRSAATRSASSRRSRSATSSSSARATPSRSAPPTSTSPAPSSRSGWAPTASAPRASAPPRSSSSPTSRGSRGRARSRPSTSTSSASARRAPRSARSPSGSTTSCARPASTSSTTTATLGPGAKFADAELLGCPLRLTVGKRSLASGEIEAQVRRGQESRALPLEGAAQAAAGPVADPGLTPSSGADRAREQMQDAAERARLTFRRLSGLDRSGPAAAGDAGRPAAAPVDDPERDRLRAAGADPGLPRARASAPTTARTPGRS